MLTRRQLLIGFGGALLIGGDLACSGAASRSPATAAGNAVALTTSTSVATSSTGQLDSRFMHGRVGWSLAMPTGAPPGGVVICLHGKDGDHRFPFDSLQLPNVVSTLGVPLAIAAVDGGHDSYWHKRADGTDAMAMLLDEFLPLVEAHVGPVPKALMGWSMGGYGALLLSERTTSTFRAVTVASPALWTSPDATAPGAFDNAADYRTYDIWSGLDRLSTMAVRVDCGTSDPFYRASRRLDARLPFRHQAVFGPGHHEPGYWRTVAPAQLQTIASALGLRSTGAP